MGNKPNLRELFTTSFSHLTAEPQNTLPASTPNYSPVSQVFSENGELIAPASASDASAANALASPQTIDAVLVVATAPISNQPHESSDMARIIHQNAQNPGEQ